jgi:hypothetical protein
MDRARTVRRLPRARVTDLRLWLGLGLVVASVVAGARLLAPDDAGIVVLRASRDLPAGARPTGLEPVRVPAGIAAAYLTEPGTGTLRWPVRRGELVPVAALAPASREPQRLVSVPVDAAAVPPGLQPDDVVDVWGSPGDGGAPRLVLAGARTASAPTVEPTLSGTVAVLLRVPADQVGAVVAAARTGDVDLVAVPPDSPDAP